MNEKFPKLGFYPADILLPTDADMAKWAVVAGDAYKVIEAALAAGKTDPEDMAEWLKQLKDMPGLTGKLGFDEKGDRVGEFYRSYMVDEQGKFVLLPQQ